MAALGKRAKLHATIPAGRLEESGANPHGKRDVADVAARKGETGLCLLAEVSDAELLAVFPGSTIEQLTDSADSDSSLATVEDLATPEQEAFLARLRAYYPELA